MATSKEAYPADEVGVLLHTAMRKLMDSKASAYAWNIVHLLNETWSGFCEAVAAAGARTGPELKEVFEDPEKWWPDLQPGERIREPLYARTIFRIALEDFDDDDWEGMAGYLSNDEQ